jgi:ABC-type branched-subunit amino acid transport system substrate-binding protein
MLFWETGAVGEMTGRGGGSLVFRVSPSGAVLGRSAVAFVAGRLAEALHRDPATLRFAVANVDDAYGRSVAAGAIAEIRSLGVPFAGQFPYDVRTRDFAPVVRSLAAARTDVLFVSAYVADAVALRRETVREHLPLVASIGTSSSYCMPQFGATLGPDAVGLFASDKPDAEVLRPSALTPGGRALLTRANASYRATYGTSMTAAALAGFSGAWALLRDVLPRARTITPSVVAAAALAARVAPGGLPNGSGLELVPPGDPGAGSNLLAASVIEEWVAPGVRAVVWPPRFATEPVRAIPLA